ncbi:MAG TPA: hypothetical protein VN898_14705 [Candidatus Binatia bacterium]|nr:hypothetical protein [Candidatus Binatia bacterium]
MSPADPATGPAAPDAAALPPLVLPCRPAPRNLMILAAMGLLAAGTVVLARALERPDAAGSWHGWVMLLLGGASAGLAGRYALARLVLDDGGFRLKGLLVDRAVRWTDIQDWKALSPGGPAESVLVVYGEARRRLFVPLIYEESQALPIGLAQRGFPRY